jgi:hypothetical protein
MGVVYEDAAQDAAGKHHVVMATIDPATGARGGVTRLVEVGTATWLGGDLDFDGTRFVFSSATREPTSQTTAAEVGTLTGSTVLRSPVAPELAGGPLSSLPDGRSLLVGARQGTIVVAAVTDAPAA